MKLSRTKLAVVLTIVAGGAIGGLVTFSPLVLRSPADDVAEPVALDPQARVERVVIHAVDVEGNVRQADSTIIAMGGLHEGSAYTILDIQRAAKSMWATGQFEDIRVRVDRHGDGRVTLIWEVDEQERADPIDQTLRILRTRIEWAKHKLRTLIQKVGVEEPLVVTLGTGNLQGA